MTNAAATPMTRYSGVAMTFHWVIAVLLIGNILLGYWFGWLEDTQHDPSALNPQGIEALMRHWSRPELVDVHKTIGISILLLSLLRLAWRLFKPRPPMGAHLAPWERMLASAVHWAFYGLMIGMPLVGWAMISASARYKFAPIHFFGLTLPQIPGLPTARHNATHELLTTIHTDWLPWLFWALLALHVLGALKHQFLDKDGELGRMIPFLREPGPR
jgi:cytochrome b561